MNFSKVGPSKFVMCPHCGNPTRRILVKRKDGPSATDVLLFGPFAFLFANRSKPSLLCERCRTIFEVRGRAIPRNHYLWIFLILLVIVVAGLFIAWRAITW